MLKVWCKGLEKNKSMYAQSMVQGINNIGLAFWL